MTGRQRLLLESEAMSQFQRNNLNKCCFKKLWTLVTEWYFITSLGVSEIKSVINFMQMLTCGFAIPGPMGASRDLLCMYLELRKLKFIYTLEAVCPENKKCI